MAVKLVAIGVAAKQEAALVVAEMVRVAVVMAAVERDAVGMVVVEQAAAMAAGTGMEERVKVVVAQAAEDSEVAAKEEVWKEAAVKAVVEMEVAGMAVEAMEKAGAWEVRTVEGLMGAEMGVKRVVQVAGRSTQGIPDKRRKLHILMASLSNGLHTMMSISWAALEVKRVKERMVMVHLATEMAETAGTSARVIMVGWVVVGWVVERKAEVVWYTQGTHYNLQT